MNTTTAAARFAFLRPLFLAAAATTVFAAALSTAKADYTWQDDSLNFQHSGNYTATDFGSNSTLLFDGTDSNTITLTGTSGTVTFDSTLSLNISTPILNLESGVGGILDIQGPVTLSGSALALNIATGSTLRFSHTDPFTTSTALTLTSTGTLALTANSNSLGAVALGTGTLALSGTGNTLGALTASDASGTLNLTGAVTAASVSGTFAAKITGGTGALTVSTGDVDFSANGNSLASLALTSGALTVSAGTTSIGNLTTGALALSGSSTLNLTGTSTATGALTTTADNTLNLTGSLAVNSVTSGALAAKITGGTGALTVSTGGVNLSATGNSLASLALTSGALTVSGGTTAIGTVTGASSTTLSGGTTTISNLTTGALDVSAATATIGALSTGSLTLNASSTLNLTGTSTATGSFASTANSKLNLTGTLTVGNSSPFSIYSQIIGRGTLNIPTTLSGGKRIRFEASSSGSDIGTLNVGANTLYLAKGTTTTIGTLYANYLLFEEEQVNTTLYLGGGTIDHFKLATSNHTLHLTGALVAGYASDRDGSGSTNGLVSGKITGDPSSSLTVTSGNINFQSGGSDFGTLKLSSSASTLTVTTGPLTLTTFNGTNSAIILTSGTTTIGTATGVTTTTLGDTSYSPTLNLSASNTLNDVVLNNSSTLNLTGGTTSITGTFTSTTTGTLLVAAGATLLLGNNSALLNPEFKLRSLSGGIIHNNSALEASFTDVNMTGSSNLVVGTFRNSVSGATITVNKDAQIGRTLDIAANTTLKNSGAVNISFSNGITVASGKTLIFTSTSSSPSVPLTTFFTLGTGTGTTNIAADAILQNTTNGVIKSSLSGTFGVFDGGHWNFDSGTPTLTRVTPNTTLQHGSNTVTIADFGATPGAHTLANTNFAFGALGGVFVSTYSGGTGTTIGTGNKIIFPQDVPFSHGLQLPLVMGTFVDPGAVVRNSSDSASTATVKVVPITNIRFEIFGTGGQDFTLMPRIAARVLYTEAGLIIEQVVPNYLRTWSGNGTKTWNSLASTDWVAKDFAFGSATDFQNGDLVTFTGATGVTVGGGVIVGKMEVTGVSDFSGGSITGNTTTTIWTYPQDTTAIPGTFTNSAGAAVTFNSTDLDFVDYTFGAPVNLGGTTKLTAHANGLTFANNLIIADAAVTIANTGAFNLQGLLQFTASNATAFDATAGNASATGAITLTGATQISVTSDFSATIAASITGNYAVEKIDTGTLALTGANTYSGATTVTAGKLKISGSGVLGYNGGTANYAGNISVANDATLEFKSSANQTLSGAAQGDGTIQQNGTGTLTIANFATYAPGTFSVGENAKLQVLGTLDSAISTFADGSRVSGTGSVTNPEFFGSVTISPGADNTSTPGASLTFVANSGVVVFTNNIFKLDISENTVDYVKVTGSKKAVFGVGNTLELTGDLPLIPGWGFPVFEADNGFTNTISLPLPDYTIKVGGTATTDYVLKFGEGSVNGNIGWLYLTRATPIPEPGTYGLLGGFGVLAFAAWRRRSRKTKREV